MADTPNKGRRTRLDRAIDEAEAAGVRVYADFDGIGLPRFSAQHRTDAGTWATVAVGRDLEDVWTAMKDVNGPFADLLRQVVADGSVIYRTPSAEEFSALTGRITRLNRVTGTLGMGPVKIIEWSKRGGAHWRPTATLQATHAARAVDEAIAVLSGVKASAKKADMLAAIRTAIGKLKGGSHA